MKIFWTFALALLACLVFAPGAQAVTSAWNYTESGICAGTVASLGSCNYDLSAASTGSGEGTEYGYLVSGTIENNVKVALTYTASHVGVDSELYWSLSQNGTKEFGPEPIISDMLTKTLYFTNTSGASLAFNASFWAILSSGVDGGVSVVMSTVPLPPSVLLFLVGMLAFVGVATYRRNRA